MRCEQRKRFQARYSCSWRRVWSFQGIPERMRNVHRETSLGANDAWETIPVERGGGETRLHKTPAIKLGSIDWLTKRTSRANKCLKDVDSFLSKAFEKNSHHRQTARHSYEFVCGNLPLVKNGVLRGAREEFKMTERIVLLVRVYLQEPIIPEPRGHQSRIDTSRSA